MASSSPSTRPDRFVEFTTIDWFQDAFRERNRRKFEDRYHSSSAPIKSIVNLYGSAQSWLVVGLVGAMIGLNAALISIITAWLSNLKMGYCQQGWWLNEKFCCWEIERSTHSREEVLIGLGGASGVIGAGGTEEGCEDWQTWTGLGAVRYLGYVFYSVLFGYMAAKLVKGFSPAAAGSGISEIKCILSGFDKPGFLSFSTLAIKSITLPLAIASGLSVGKEGPSVHMAACIGFVLANQFHRFRKSRRKMRELVTAASAAGVAVAFGSPVGGVLFAFEEMTISFPIKTMWRSFFCAMIATVTLSAVNPFRTGKLVLFQVSYDRDWHFFEVGFFVLIGLFGGLYGAFVTKYNLQVAVFRRRHLANSAISEVVFLAGLTAIIGYFNMFLRIDMTESLEILFRECEGGGDYDGLCQSWAQWQMVNSLLLATVIRACLVVLSFGCRVPAGIFIPSMAVGATFGRMLGILVKALYRAYPHWTMFSACDPEKPCITPGTYALLGSAAALGGIMRITVSVVVIMFELTGALTYILPTMVVLLVTKAVSDQLVKGHGGIADKMIHLNGFPCLEKEDHLHGLAVGAVMTGRAHGVKLANETHQVDFSASSGHLNPNSTALALPSQLPLHELKTILGTERNGRAKGFSGWPIVSDALDLSILGYVSSADLTKTINDATLTRFSDDVIVVLSRKSRKERQEEGEEEEGYGVHAGSSHRMFERLDLSYLVNPTPVRVNPKQPLEMVVSLFKKIGPRMVLVESNGSLVGLITLKDLLRYEGRGAKQDGSGPGRRLRLDGPSHKPHADQQDENGNDDGDDDEEEEAGDLEELLEDAKDLCRDLRAAWVRWVKGPAAASASSHSSATHHTI
ncbi:glycerol ethanol, ferric requiring protein [Puccinia graminis f. sp. tritici]|uniref:Chloride channel protein n=1 Tax=Puccinia graminis f. sp. tritici TaxID=56615 RepID=A0A5B0QBG0_PUCGR|nr:glycerol ethanol, ferric requiring protein [Puccinia graminis f. sp. tritici]